MNDDQARIAAEALAEVTRSADALLRFRAAYTGERDGVEVLRRLSSPQESGASDGPAATAARIDDLLRAAFSRTQDPEEEELAATARDELETIERREADDSAALVAARALLGRDEPAPTAVTPTPVPPTQDQDEPRPWWPLRTRRNLAVVVIAAFVVGAVASAGFMTLRPNGGAATSASSATPTPTRSTPGFDADQNGEEAQTITGLPDTSGFAVPDATAPRGNLTAARRWFDRPQVARDKLDALAGLDYDEMMIDPTSTRLVQSSTPASVWIAQAAPKNGRETLCLIVGSVGGDFYATSCVNGVEFTQRGLQISRSGPSPGDDGVTATWTGTEMTVTFGP